MGLSDEERFSGVIFAVNRMTQLGKNTPAQKFTDQMWHALLGKSSNSAHWIIGSSASNDIKIDGKSVWEAAMIHHTYDVFKEKDSDPISEKIEDMRRDDVVEHHFSIGALLREKGIQRRWTKNDPVYANMFELYAWSEQLIYYLRRYEDDMRKDFKELDKLISDIQGECFDHFGQHEVYAKAYVVHKIIKHLYSGTYPYQKNKWNELVRWLVKNHVYHDMNRCMEMELKELAEIHVSIVRDKSIKNKVICLGKILVRRLHKYKDDNFLKKHIPKEMWVKAEKMYEDHEKPDEDRQSELSLYGWDYYSEK